MGRKRADPTAGELGGIDRVVHEPARLVILANLYVVESADYTYLMNRTGLTWGNLSGAPQQAGGSRVCEDREGICAEKTAHDGAVDERGKKGV